MGGMKCHSNFFSGEVLGGHVATLNTMIGASQGTSAKAQAHLQKLAQKNGAKKR